MQNDHSPIGFWEEHIIRWEKFRYSTLARLNPFAWTVRSRSRHAMRMLHRYLRPGCRILDLGCGGGHLLSRLKTEFPVSYVGVDFSVRAIEKARSIAPARQVTSEFQICDLRSNHPFSADVAVLLGVVDWFELAEFGDVLKSLRVKHLILSFTEKRTGVATLFYGFYRRFMGIRKAAYSARSYSTEQILETVRKAGFDAFEIIAPVSMRPGKLLLAEKIT